jgi:hypothetical protein
MKRVDAGIASTSVSAKTPAKTVSPAARKFAEYLARRLRPMIESRQEEQPPVTGGNS